jgi:hypothetical protein
VIPQRCSAQVIDSSLLPKNWGVPAIFEKQIETRLLHPASTEGVTDSGISLDLHYFIGLTCTFVLCRLHQRFEPESVTPERCSAQAFDSCLLPKNFNEPMGAPAIFEKQIEPESVTP